MRSNLDSDGSDQEDLFVNELSLWSFFIKMQVRIYISSYSDDLNVQSIQTLKHTSVVDGESSADFRFLYFPWYLFLPNWGQCVLNSLNVFNSMILILFCVVSPRKTRHVHNLRDSRSESQSVLELETALLTGSTPDSQTTVLCPGQHERDLFFLNQACAFPQLAPSLPEKPVVQRWLSDWWWQCLTHGPLHFFLFLFLLTVCAAWSQDCQCSDNSFLEAISWETQTFLCWMTLGNIRAFFPNLPVSVNLSLLSVRDFAERQEDKIFPRVCCLCKVRCRIYKCCI